MSLLRLTDYVQEASAWSSHALSQWTRQALGFMNNYPWVTLGVTTGALMSWSMLTRQKDLPPGPLNLPVIGAVSCIREDLEVKLLQMRQQYGEIIYFKVLGNEMVMLLSERIIRKAFSNSDIFVHRYISPCLTNTGIKDEMFTAEYDNNWNANKKFALTALRAGGFGNAKSELKIHQCLEKLDEQLLNLHNSNQSFDIMDLLKIYSAMVSYAIYFDLELPYSDERLVTLAAHGSTFYLAISACEKLGFFFGKYPILRNLILGRKEAEGRLSMDIFFNDLKKIYRESGETYDPENLRGVLDYYRAYRGTEPGIEHTLANLLINFLPDSLDTTALILTWAIFYLAFNPDIQQKLQKELNKVIGTERDPSLSDRPNLPFTEAVILETIRLSDTIPINIPREVKTDTWFEGYRIPKGALVLSCLHAVHYDPEIFPEPEKFNPSRYLDVDGKINQSKAKSVMMFGLGRRACPGEQYAKIYIYMTLSHLMQKYTVEFDENESKPSMTPDLNHSFKYPSQFKVRLCPQ